MATISELQGVSLEEPVDQRDGFLRWYNESSIKMNLGAISHLDCRRSLTLVAWLSPKCGHPLWMGIILTFAPYHCS